MLKYKYMKKKILIILLILLGLTAFLFWTIFKKSSDSWDTQTANKIPIVYSDNYNITFLGIQKLHPFDSEKYGKVADYLIGNSDIKKEQFYVPKKITNQELLTVHTRRYLDSLKNSKVAARIAEIGLLAVTPNFIIQKRLLDPVRHATGGTVLGAQLAIKEGWAINLAGGYHHTKADESSGFGFYADIPLAVKKLWEDNPELKVLIIDFDAHQGNGNEAIFKDDPGIFILDIYHEDNLPKDDAVKKYIDYNWPVGPIDDPSYLTIVSKAIPEAIEDSNPGLIIYNAGTDVYHKDKLGKMNLSKGGIIKRDEAVFKYATDNSIPILMVLSGGYSSESAHIIGESIVNIYSKYLKD